MQRTEELLELYRRMLLIRRMEERLGEVVKTGELPGPVHLYIGQEAVAVGVCSHLGDRDWITSTHRGHGHFLAKGGDPHAMIAEILGRDTGICHGKGGSMHVFDRDVRFMGGHGIVGAQVPLATGIAWKLKYRDEDNIVVCFMGDAAVNQGAFHEALNMAAIWDLPAIYVVENNHYGMGTAFGRVSLTEMVEKASPYGIPASVVNGQDVLATYAHFRRLAEEVRDGGGPRFVNVETYRFRGHSMSDPVSGTYRPKDEVEQKTQEEDPIGILRDHLFDGGHLDQAGLEAMDQEAREVARDAAEFADGSPAPGPEALYENVWAEINRHGRLNFDGRGESPWR